MEGNKSVQGDEECQIKEDGVPGDSYVEKMLFDHVSEDMRK